jgi:CheY-like chemotaxis protein
MQQADSSPAPRHILVIDDDPAVRAVIGSMVQRFGFTPLLAEDGIEGLELLRRHATSVDCTLVDVTLPKWSGAETRERIRHEFPRAPVILISGHADMAPAGGGTLLKPFTWRELQSAVARVIAARAEV